MNHISHRKFLGDLILVEYLRPQEEQNEDEEDDYAGEDPATIPVPCTVTLSVSVIFVVVAIISSLRQLRSDFD